MNLVKNGTVLLAALSILAFTSCNKGMSYKDAINWVKEHYKNPDDNIKEVKKATYEWNYSNNVAKDKIPVRGAEIDINYLVKEAIQERFNIENIGDDDHGTMQNVDYKRGIVNATTFYNAEGLTEDYNLEKWEAEEGNENVNFSFKTDKNQLTITATLRLTYEIEDLSTKITFNETEIKVVDDTGYTLSYEYIMKQNDLKINVAGTDYNLGKLDSSMKVTAVERGPEKPRTELK